MLVHITNYTIRIHAHISPWFLNLKMQRTGLCLSSALPCHSIFTLQLDY
ncbi:hypothetical protein EDO6_04107 [Paenibacillus xylanexedens]|nr:hypothetical protein EDO6_04107 [Paenibacillus xylanexedens]